MRLILPLLILLTGCAGKALQSDRIHKRELQIPEKKKAQNVVFVPQIKDHCGPATVSMAFDWAGVEISPQKAAQEVFTPGVKGTYQMDVISASRRYGLMALKVTSMENLLLELSKGTPVVVFQNLGFGWYELWHYSLVTGYDLGKRELLLNSGKEQDTRLSFDKFERGWKRGGYWGVVLLPAGMLSETGSLIDHLKAAAAIEKAGKRVLASKAYKAILSRWNDSHWAWFGLGNLNGQEGELELAKKNFELALKINPQFSYAWYNYAFLLKNLGQFPSAKSAAANAIKYVDPVNKGLFRESLSDANLL